MSNIHQHSRPLTVAIPDAAFKANGAYCPRKPKLSDILTNQAPPPWTLSAFMAYLSHNHCLETLEFIMDAKRYRQHYEKISSKSPGGQIAPGSDQAIHVNMLWQRLIEAYIQPNGTREVNLPSDVRDGILTQDTSAVPPHPDTLIRAIDKVHELMEESVLVPFLNSVYPQTAHPNSNNSSVEDLTTSTSHEGPGLFRSRTSKKKAHRSSPLSGSPPLPHSASGSPPVMPTQLHRASAPSAITRFARDLSNSARQGFPIPHSAHSSHSSARPLSSVHPLPTNFDSSTPGYQTMEDLSSLAPPSLTTPTTDDNVSTPSLHGEPMTPPTTPPTNDMGISPSSGGMGRGNPWKRMRYSFGWRK